MATGDTSIALLVSVDGVATLFTVVVVVTGVVSMAVLLLSDEVVGGLASVNPVKTSLKSSSSSAFPGLGMLF